MMKFVSVCCAKIQLFFFSVKSDIGDVDLLEWSMVVDAHDNTAVDIEVCLLKKKES